MDSKEFCMEIFNYEGDPPFCFKKAFNHLTNAFHYINKLGLSGDFLTELNIIERETAEKIFTLIKEIDVLGSNKRSLEKVEKLLGKETLEELFK